MSNDPHKKATREDFVLQDVHTPESSGWFAGIIGDPVEHSLSPLIHRAAYEALGIDDGYGAFRVAAEDVGAAIERARAEGLRGLSVTTPLKDVVVEFATAMSETVAVLSAANTVVFAARDETVAESTDGIGLVDDLPRACDFDVASKSCAVLGAGATAHAVVLALANHGANEVLVANRTSENAVRAASLAGRRGHVVEAEALGSADLVVNATSVGFRTGASAALLEQAASSLHRGQLIVDLVYFPASTWFLQQGAAVGARTRNGLGMLVHQAAYQVELFTGERAPLDAMWRAVGHLVEE